MEVYTIGFTKRSAASFFGALRAKGIRRLIDVRLNNSSQLAGFTKQEDLRYFLRELCGADYLHEPMLAPTVEILNSYKKNGAEWSEYERRFLALMDDRRPDLKLDRGLFQVPTVFLCSEARPDHCHRCLVAEYLQRKWGDLEIIHL